MNITKDNPPIRYMDALDKVFGDKYMICGGFARDYFLHSKYDNYEWELKDLDIVTTVSYETLLNFERANLIKDLTTLDGTNQQVVTFMIDDFQVDCKLYKQLNIKHMNTERDLNINSIYIHKGKLITPFGLHNVDQKRLFIDEIYPGNMHEDRIRLLKTKFRIAELKEKGIPFRLSERVKSALKDLDTLKSHSTESRIERTYDKAKRANFHINMFDINVFDTDNINCGNPVFNNAIDLENYIRINKRDCGEYFIDVCGFKQKYFNVMSQFTDAYFSVDIILPDYDEIDMKSAKSDINFDKIEKMYNVGINFEGPWNVVDIYDYFIKNMKDHPHYSKYHNETIMEHIKECTKLATNHYKTDRQLTGLEIDVVKYHDLGKLITAELNGFNETQCYDHEKHSAFLALYLTKKQDRKYGRKVSTMVLNHMKRDGSMEWFDQIDSDGRK